MSDDIWLQTEPPKPSQYRTVNVPVDLWREVLIRAAHMGLSPGRFVRLVLEEAFARDFTVERCSERGGR